MLGFLRLDECYSASQSRFSSWRKAEGWGRCEAQPQELAPGAQVIPVLPPVLPHPGAMSWQLKSAQKSGACCHQLLLRSKRAIFIREEWKEGPKLGIHWVGWQVVLCTSNFSLSPGEKRAWSHTSSLFYSQGALKEGENFMGLMGLHHVLGSYHIMDTWSKNVPHGLPKKQCRQRHLLCSHRPGVRQTGAFALVCAWSCLKILAKNYSAGKMTPRSALHMLSNCGELQAAWV